MAKDEIVMLAHGSGGRASQDLVNRIATFYTSPELKEMGDSALVTISAKTLGLLADKRKEGTEQPLQFAMTTDSFVVDPIFFPGGDIGKLAVCGTVNDLLMRGAKPSYLTVGMIIEEGFPFTDLETISRSIGKTAAAAGVRIVAGDTKVVERRHEAGGLFINTAGVGLYPASVKPAPVADLQPGDAVILSGTLGDHHAVIMSQRLGIQNDLLSDAACLGDIVSAVQGMGASVHAMRDVTRGGLASVLNELAEAAAVQVLLEEEAIPLHPTVKGLCGMLGLDPLEMGNEGKLVLFVPQEEEEAVLEAIRATENGRKAAIIGRVKAISNGESGVCLRTEIGTERAVMPLMGEGLPRIC